MARPIRTAIAVIALFPVVTWAQSLTGLRIEGPDEVVENTVTLYTVIAEFDNGWEFDVTLDSILWTEPGIHADIGVFGDFEAFEVETDDVETIHAVYAFGPDVEMATLDVTILDIPPGGFALDFDGVDDIVLVPGSDTLAYPGAGGWTIEAWLYPRNVHPSLGVPVAGQLSMGLPARDPYVIGIEDGFVHFRIDNAFGNSQMIEAPIAAEQWTHVAGVYDQDNGVGNLYVNGIQAAWEPLSIFMESNSAYTILFGGQGDGPRQYDGLIDELRIWESARTYCEIRGYMSRRLLGNEPHLVGYWPLDEGEGQDVLDSCPFGNHGTLGGNGSPEPNDPEWVLSGADLSLGPFAPVAWTTPQLIPEVSSGEDWNVGISSDQLEIYIGSERDGFAESEIYRAVRASVDEPFSTPVPVWELSIPGYREHDNICTLSADGLRIYFNRHYWHGPAYLYVAERDTLAAPWGTSVLIDSLNTHANEYGLAVSSDELLAVLTSGRSGEYRYWAASRDSVSEPWGNLVFIDSLAGFAPSGCALSPDGLTLYVTATGPTGLGGHDVWRLTRSSTTAPFGEPVHIPELSSNKEEFDVSVSPDGRTMYLVRERFSNAGDVYVAQLAIPGGPVDGELDCDGDIDLDDFSEFAECMTGPGGGVPDGCNPADYNLDADVDLADYRKFQNLFTGVQ